MIELAAVDCLRGGRKALTNIGLHMECGEFVALCGLNGAGKSTLLEILAGLLSDYSGNCKVEGVEMRDWKPRALARRVSFLPQSTVHAPRFTCAEVVHMGRYPFAHGWSPSVEDDAICRAAMIQAGCEEFRGRYLNGLSGGERQRVLLAAVLAQKPAVLLLDEPGTFVDLPHQLAMFRTLRDLCGQQLLCVAATHDLNLAAAFCSRIILLDRGAVAADLAPRDLPSSDGFRRVFGDHIRIERDGGGVVRVHYAV